VGASEVCVVVVAVVADAAGFGFGFGFLLEESSGPMLEGSDDVATRTPDSLIEVLTGDRGPRASAPESKQEAGKHFHEHGSDMMSQ